MKLSEHIEKKKHGTPQFQIQYYYVDKSHPRYIMPLHWHREFEIIKIVSGTFTARLNDNEFILNSGDILLVGSGCLHSGFPINCVYECVVVDLTMLIRQQNDAVEKYILPITQSQITLNNPITSNQKELCKTIDKLFLSLNQNDSYFELTVYSLLFDLISQLYSKNYIRLLDNPTPNKQFSSVIKVIDWIDKNFKENITLEFLSEFTNLNPKYLCRIFKTYTDKTITQYINECRINNACYEISEKHKSVTEAAFNSGFNDLSYFTKTFKRYNGIAPNEFKKNAKSSRK